ncbi:MAG: lysophospholipid acyltransferase family protein [Microlunatus sp.]
MRRIRLRGRLRTVNREPGDPVMVTAVRTLHLIFNPFIRKDWRGQEHIPQTGGVIIVANHISNIDPIMLGLYLAYSGRWPRFMAKGSLFKVPVLGWALLSAGQIPVQRNSRQAGQAIGAAREALERGRTVVIYPEATITHDPELWPMEGRTGAARIALATGCPVIPVGQWGAEEIMWGKKVHFPKLLPRKTVRMLAGPQVPLDDLRGQPLTSQNLAQATDRIMDAISSLVAELRHATPPDQRYDPREPGGGRGGAVDPEAADAGSTGSDATDTEVADAQAADTDAGETEREEPT